MGYIVIIIACVALILTSLKLFKKDYLSPSFITALMYLIVVVSAVLGLTSWNDDTSIELLTILIFISGFIAVFLGELLYRHFPSRQKEKKEDILVSREEKKFILPIWLNILIICFVAITIVLTFHEINRICLFYGHTPTDLGDMLSFYRTKTLLFTNEAVDSGVTINFIVSQMQKISYLVCVFDMFLIVKNILSKRRFVRLIIFPMITVVLCSILALLTSSRSMAAHFVIAFIVLVLLLSSYRKEQKDVREKKIKWGILSAVVVGAVAVFYFLVPVVGRNTNMNAFEYTTFYAGSSIPALDIALKENLFPERSNGQRTFYGLQYSLARLGVTDSYPESNRTGVVFGTYGGSNVFSAFGSYYFDFGFPGVIFLGFLFGFITTAAYDFTRKHRDNMFVVVLYAYYFYVLIDQVRGDLLFSLFSISTISYVVIAYLIYKVYSYYVEAKR